jgi:hypothetical protein
MAGKRKQPTKAKAVPELIFEDGYYWIVQGTKRLNVGRNQAYAERYLQNEFKSK